MLPRSADNQHKFANFYISDNKQDMQVDFICNNRNFISRSVAKKMIDDHVVIGAFSQGQQIAFIAISLHGANKAFIHEQVYSRSMTDQDKVDFLKAINNMPGLENKVWEIKTEIYPSKHSLWFEAKKRLAKEYPPLRDGEVPKVPGILAKL